MSLGTGGNAVDHKRASDLWDRSCHRVIDNLEALSQTRVGQDISDFEDDFGLCTRYAELIGKGCRVDAGRSFEHLVNGCHQFDIGRHERHGSAIGRSCESATSHPRFAVAHPREIVSALRGRHNPLTQRAPHRLHVRHVEFATGAGAVPSFDTGEHR